VEAVELEELFWRRSRNEQRMEKVDQRAGRAMASGESKIAGPKSKGLAWVK